MTNKMPQKNVNADSCVVLPLSGDMDVSGFDCGDADLNDFLQTDALKNQKEWFSVTKVLFLDDALAGYFTIVADTLHKGRVAEPDAVSGYPYQKYPAVKLARLAVDVRFQHQGIGSILMEEFFDAAYSCVEGDGGRFLTVDSVPSARTFYERFGFRAVSSLADEETVPMYLDFYKFYLLSREIFESRSV